MQIVYNGADTAADMRKAIVDMIGQRIAQAVDLSRGTCSIKQSARHAGEIAALETIRAQIADIKLEVQGE